MKSPSWNGGNGTGRPRLGFPRACRLVRRSEFEAVYRGGRRLASSQFIIFFLPNGRGLSRFGISVKRVRPGRGGAVLRNRIRRRIREILRVHRQEIASGWDIVIHPRSSVATEQSRVLTTKLLEQLRSALGSGATKSE